MKTVLVIAIFAALCVYAVSAQETGACCAQKDTRLVCSDIGEEFCTPPELATFYPGESCATLDCNNPPSASTGGTPGNGQGGVTGNGNGQGPPGGQAGTGTGVGTATGAGGGATGNGGGSQATTAGTGRGRGN